MADYFSMTFWFGKMHFRYQIYNWNSVIFKLKCQKRLISLLVLIQVFIKPISDIRYIVQYWTNIFRTTWNYGWLKIRYQIHCWILDKYTQDNLELWLIRKSKELKVNFRYQIHSSILDRNLEQNMKLWLITFQWPFDLAR